MKGTNKLKEHTESIFFDSQKGLSQSEENKCIWTYGKDCVMWHHKNYVILVIEYSQLNGRCLRTRELKMSIMNAGFHLAKIYQHLTLSCGSIQSIKGGGGD